MKAARKKKILVVHDHSRTRLAISLYLMRRGFDVRSAHCATSFRNSIFHEKLDLLILSRRLDGRETRAIYDWLLTIGLDENIPVFFTSSPDYSPRWASSRVRGTIYVDEKPLSARALSDDVAQIFKF